MCAVVAMFNSTSGQVMPEQVADQFLAGQPASLGPTIGWEPIANNRGQGKRAL